MSVQFFPTYEQVLRSKFGGLILDVREYGADPTGVQDSSNAINNAIVDCHNHGGGTVWGVGTFYLGAGPVFPLSGVTLRGGGEGSTVFTANGALPGGSADLIRIAQGTPHYSNVRIAGIELDCTNQTAGNGMTMDGVDNLTIEDIIVIESYGAAIQWGSTGGTAPYILNPVARNVYALGCGRSGADSFGGGGISNGLIDGYWCEDSPSGTVPGGSAWDNTNLNGFKITNAYAYSSGSVAALAFGSDFGAVGLTIKDVWVTGWEYGVQIGGASSGVPSDLTIDGLHAVNVSSAGVNFSFSPGYSVQRFKIINSDFASWSAAPALSLDGGHNGIVANNTFASNTVSYAIRLRGDNGSTTSNPPSDIVVTNNDVTLPTYKIYPAFIGAGVVFRNNPGYNPLGPVTVAVPASGAATAALPYDSTYYITQATAASSVAVQGQTIAIPVGGPTAIRVPAGQTLTPTYTTAPTWVVLGE